MCSDARNEKEEYRLKKEIIQDQISPCRDFIPWEFIIFYYTAIQWFKNTLQHRITLRPRKALSLVQSIEWLRPPLSSIIPNQVLFPARCAAAVWFGAKRLQKNNEPSPHSKSLYTSGNHPQVHNFHCMVLLQHILIFCSLTCFFFLFFSNPCLALLRCHCIESNWLLWDTLLQLRDFFGL